MTMLQNRAMLANLVVRQWTARKLDRSVGAEVDKAHGANDAGRYNKLLVDKSALEPIVKAANALRAAHYHYTMPWGDNGDRLLPSTLYMEYTSKMRNLKDDFRTAVRTFIQNYPALCQSARNRLGTLYEPNDYPSSVDLHTKFDVHVGFTPVPDAKDFRVEVDQDQVEQIRNDITAAVEARQAEAVRSCYGRAFEVVARIRDRLSIKDGRFNDTLIENARVVTGLIPALNITGDETLTELCDEIKARLLVEPTVLRNNPTVRASVARAANDILQKYNAPADA